MFRAALFAAGLAVGCGGRTSGSSGNTSGSVGSTGAPSGSGAVTGSIVGGAGVAGGGGAGVLSGTPAMGQFVLACAGDGPTIVLQCPSGATCQYDAAGGAYCVCSGGEEICPGGTDISGMVCVDQETDPNNCGGCGVVCAQESMSDPSLTCQRGNCTPITDASADASGDGTEAGPDAGTPPSCAPGGPGMTNCGPGGIGTESCCTSLEVIGGTYDRTYDYDGTNPDGGPIVAADGGPTGEADPATVSSFRLDKYLVTVGRFRQFVSAVLPADGRAEWLPSPGSGKHMHLNGGNGLVDVGASADAGTVYEPGWVQTDNGAIAPTNANLACKFYAGSLTYPPNTVFDIGTWTHSVGSNENLPINCVTWEEAYAFCIWDGGFLPSEAEWGYAAAGGSQQREYPWGSTDPGIDNQYAIRGCDYPNNMFGCTGVANIAPVGTASLGAGFWGQLDLTGNLSEWNLDWYAANYVDPCADCAYVTPPPVGQFYDRVVRGGTFAAFLFDLLSSERFLPRPGPVDGGRGFRCARTP